LNLTAVNHALHSLHLAVKFKFYANFTQDDQRVAGVALLGVVKGLNVLNIDWFSRRCEPLHNLHNDAGQQRNRKNTRPRSNDVLSAPLKRDLSTVAMRRGRGSAGCGPVSSKKDRN